MYEIIFFKAILFSFMAELWALMYHENIFTIIESPYIQPAPKAPHVRTPQAQKQV